MVVPARCALAILLVGACATVSRAAPPREPVPGARIVFRLGTNLFLAFAASPLARLHDALQDCDIEFSRDFSVVEGVAESTQRYHVEVKGSITTRKLSCIFGDLGRFPIRDSQDGVVLGDPEPESPGVLGPLFDMAGGAPYAIAVDLHDVSPAKAALLYSDGTQAEIRVRFADAKTAERGQAQVTAAIDEVEKEVPLIHDVTTHTDGNDLIVDTPSPVATAVIARAAFLEAFIQASGGAAPTIRDGEHVFALKGPLRNPPARGDVVVFPCPRNAKADCMARIVAMGGDRVRFQHGAFILNGKPVATQKVGEETDVDDESGQTMTVDRVRETVGSRSWLTFRRRTPPTHDTADAEVPDGSAFVVGDNRDASDDSRSYGPVPLASIKGRVFVIWWTSAKSRGQWERLGLIQ
jgi:signal peptidase I